MERRARKRAWAWEAVSFNGGVEGFGGVVVVLVVDLLVGYLGGDAMVRGG